MADVITIRVNRASTDRLLRQLEQALDNETLVPGSRGIILRRTAKELQEGVQNRILSGGQGKWPPLSKWTVGRTGRTVPLQPLAGRVKRRFRQGRAEVYFDSPSQEWNLTSHHYGFNVRETHALMRIPQLVGGAVFLRRRRPYRVPARPVWPTERQAVTVLNRNIRAFIAHITRGSSTTFGPAR